MSELRIFRCTDCGVHLFLERLRCPRCGGRSFDLVPAGPGQVRERTMVRKSAVTLASVHLDKGPVVVARTEEAPSADVTLEQHADGAITTRRQ